MPAPEQFVTPDGNHCSSTCFFAQLCSKVICSLDIDAIAFMDIVLGSRDRHEGNMLLCHSKRLAVDNSDILGSRGVQAPVVALLASGRRHRCSVNWKLMGCKFLLRPRSVPAACS